MLPGARTVAAKKAGARPPGNTSAPRRPSLVDELHDGDGDGAEQEDVYEALAAEDEFADRPRREERGG